MLRLAQRTSALGASARLLAPSSISAKQERNTSTKKAVLFNAGGSLLPAMSPVLSKYARESGVTESEVISKLFKDGDKGMMEQLEPALRSRHGSEKTNLAHIISAIKSIRGDGFKTGLISEAGGLNHNLMPVDKELFDVVAPALKADVLDKLRVDSSDVVYLDNVEANLKAARAMGMTAIQVDDIKAALVELESSLQIPLKENIPGFTWIFWDNANNPYKSTSENLLYLLVCIYLVMYAGHFTLKNIFGLDGNQQH